MDAGMSARLFAKAIYSIISMLNKTQTPLS
jgi:hypothetical protein